MTETEKLLNALQRQCDAVEQNNELLREFIRVFGGHVRDSEEMQRNERIRQEFHASMRRRRKRQAGPGQHDPIN